MAAATGTALLQHSAAQQCRQALLLLPPRAANQRRQRDVCHAVAARVPKGVLQQLESAHQQWLTHALSSKLHDKDTGCTVILLGVCFFAPLQHALVADALQQIQAEYVALEQPGNPSGVLLPYPQWIQAVLDHGSFVEATLQQTALQDAASSSMPSPSQGLSELQQQLRSISHPNAAVGRDILDPFETFGYYPGLDMFRQPDSTASILQLCGYLPGQELVLAAHHAEVTGAQLSCIDAPLKLQEGWVKQLLDSFRLDERQVNSFQPRKDYTFNQRLLHPAAEAWDRQLAAAAAGRDAVQNDSTNGNSVSDKQHTAVGLYSPDLTAQQQSLLLYKASRATAAAMLMPEQTCEAIERLQRLQPLKWAHFALRQRFMAHQLKELCMVASRRASSDKPVAAQQQQQHGGAAGSQSQAGSISSNRASKPITIVAVVGRQHVHALQRMWQDPASPLWQDRMPKSFAKSVVETQEDTSKAADDGSSSSNVGRQQ